MKTILILLSLTVSAMSVTPHDIRIRQLNSTATGEVIFTIPYPASGLYATVFYEIGTNTPMAAPWDTSITYDAVSGSMGVDQTWMDAQTAGKLDSASFTWANLTGKPSFFSGAYADLTGKPTLFSGAYADLSGKPTIPTVPTNVSAFTNDSAYLNQAGVRASISLTTTGTGAATYNNGTGVINVPTPSLTLPNTGTAGTYGTVTTDAQGRVTAGKRAETYSGTSAVTTGLYTVTFGTPYSVAPNIQANIINPTDNQSLRITSISTTGFTVLARLRTDVVGLLPAFSNAAGLSIDVLITEK